MVLTFSELEEVELSAKTTRDYLLGLQLNRGGELPSAFGNGSMDFYGDGKNCLFLMGQLGSEEACCCASQDLKQHRL